MSILAKLRKIIVACLLLLFGLPSQASAVGIFLTNEYQQIVAAQAKVAIFHDGQTETLIASETFSFNPLVAWNFLWLIPVPARPEVEPVNGDLFAGLDKLLAPRETTGDGPEQTSLRAASIIRFEIFGPPQEPQVLKDWVQESGYFLPKNLPPKLDDYWQKGWYFVVAEVDGVHIQRTASDSLFVQNAFVLPLKITFPAEELVIPLAITGTQPDLDSEAVPLSFAYGTPSAQVLGITNEAVDAELAAPSLNKYPRLPLQLLNFKLDLFIFAERRTELPEFELLETAKIDGRKFGTDSWNNFYLRLPPKKLVLTHLVAYKPFQELRDLRWPALPGKQSLWLLASGIGLLLLGGLLLVAKIRGTFQAKKIVVISAILILGGGGALTGWWLRPVWLGNPGKQKVEGLGLERFSSEARVVELASGLYFFSPNMIHARAGEKIRLRIESDDLHTFTIDELGIDSQTPVGTTEVEFTAPKAPGSYEFYCAIAGHREAGQVGILIVE